MASKKRATPSRRKSPAQRTRARKPSKVEGVIAAPAQPAPIPDAPEVHEPAKHEQSPERHPGSPVVARKAPAAAPARSYADLLRNAIAWLREAVKEALS